MADWKTNPNSLVGERIKVLWSKGKKYEGLVTKYYPVTGKHQVEYDDGDVKLYDMEVKTFWLDNGTEFRPSQSSQPISTQGGGQATTGRQYSSGGYYSSNAYSHVPKWNEYKSKYPNANTRVTFHVLLDPRACKEGEAVFLDGSPEALTAWGGGVPMTRDPADPQIWECTIDLPFTMSDFAQSGIFQFQYVVMSDREGAIREGPPRKTENRLKKNFYHTFRSNYQYPRFRGWVSLTGKASLQRFTNCMLLNYRDGHIQIPQLVQNFVNLAECTIGAHRAHIEELVDEVIRDYEKARTEVPRDLLMAFAGMIGHFGATSKETVYVSSYTSSYGGGTGWGSAHQSYSGAGSAGKLTRRTPPKPKPWCWLLIQNMDVADWMSFPLKDEFGMFNARKVVEGVGEAVERLSEDGSFEWLRVMPFLEQYEHEPRVLKKVTKRMVKHFQEVANMIMPQAEELGARGLVELTEMNQAREARKLAHEAAEQATTEAPVTDLIGLSGLGNIILDDEEEEREPVSLQLSRSWLRSLITYAPSMEVVASLFQGTLGNRLDELLPTIATKIEDSHFSDEEELALLHSMMLEAPLLQDVSIAISMLKNTTLDKFPEEVTNLVALAITQAFTQAKEVAEAELGVAEGKNEVSEASGQISQPLRLEGSWLDLNSAAKSWLYREHGDEPALQRKSTKESDGWFYKQGKRYFSKAAKDHVPEDRLVRQRTEMLQAALDSANRLMHIPFFAEHPRTLTFELTRCWFLNGNRLHVLRSLCALGAEGQGFGAFHPLLASFLQEMAQKVVADCASSSTNKSLEIISEAFDPHNALSHLLLYSLAVAVTWPNVAQANAAGMAPPLQSVLENADMWIALSERLEKGRLESSLSSLCSSVRNLLIETSSSIASEEVVLRTLHVVINQKEDFLQLLVNLGLQDGSLNEHILEQMKESLAHFDKTLEHAQCYASFFCGCGVKIDAITIRQLIEQKRSGYHNLKLLEIQDSFSSLDALPHLEWLFKLRSSELFLEIWRQTGNEVIVEQVAGARQMILENEQQAEAQPEELPDIPDDPNMTEEQRIQQAEERMQRELARQEEEFQRRDRLEQMMAQVEDVTLTQAQICTEVIPRATETWENLARAVVDGSLSVEKLGTSFGKLDSEEQVNEELRFLLSTAVCTKDSYTQRWEDCVANMAAYTTLKNSCEWLPSLIRLHNLISGLCEVPPNLDPLHQQLKGAISTIDQTWDSLTLSSAVTVIGPVRQIFDAYSTEQLEFLAALGAGDSLLKWLLEQSSTEEFNRLLQVCRPCTDEPRLLSSIASLVHIRTMLIQPFYTDPPFNNLRSFLESFQAVDLTGYEGESGMWHLQNIIQSFDSLMDVFEKQTRSPGIKSCYDLKELLEKGTFKFSATADISQVLTVEITEEQKEEEGEGQARSRIEQLDYLLDLRSKLLMTEIPPELEDEMQASVMVEAFVQQLQVLSEIGDAISGLYSAGHIEYQEGYSSQFKFELDGLQSLQAELTKLQTQASSWARSVKDARDEYYFLNYYTMREILKMKDLASAPAEVDVETGEAEEIAADEAKGDTDEAKGKEGEGVKGGDTDEGKVQVEIQHPQQYKVVGPKGIALAESPDLNSPRIQKGELPQNTIVTVGPVKPEHTNHELVKSGRRVYIIEPQEGYCSVYTNNKTILLEPVENSPPGVLVGAQEEAAPPEVEQMMQMGFSREWAEVALRRCDQKIDQAVDFCFSQSQFMDRIIEEDRISQAKSTDTMQHTMVSDPLIEEVPMHKNPFQEFVSLLHLVSSEVDLERATVAMQLFKTLLGEGTSLLESLGQTLKEVFGRTSDECAFMIHNRAVNLPTAMATNRADMLIHVDDGDEQKLPIFVTASDTPSLVLDTVLSVFCRRGRLPEPSEILFCTTQTTMEDLELFLRRFIKAESHGRSHYVWTMADLHNLSYTVQCSFVDRLRSILQEYGTKDAATLLLASGRPRQVVLNSLSSNWVDLPPLQEVELRRALKDAFQKHCGETKVVTSEINGGGKSHWIMRSVGERQHLGEALTYWRVPLRENSTPNTIVEQFTAAHDPQFCPPGVEASAFRRAFHIDIAHIIPAAANTILFQLLIVGALRDPVACQVYAKSKDDIVYIEIPNSVGNKTAQALRFCSLIPTKLLVVTKERMQLTAPLFTDPLCTQIALPEYSEMIYVCKWLRAFKSGVFDRSSGSFNPDFSVHTAEEITPAQCFEIMKEQCCAEDGPSPHPSWSLFHSFTVFMNQQFTYVETYPLLSGAVLAMTEGLEPFKQVFIRLLIETSRDFSLRSVAQVPNVGPDPTNSENLEGGFDMMPAPPETNPSLRGSRRNSSASHISQSMLLSEARRLADAQMPEELVQEDRDLVRRFQTLASWESSDHPVVLFKPDGHGGVSGVDILSMNRQFLGNYIQGALKAALEANFISFDKDWEKLTNPEAVELLRQIEGLNFGDRGGLQSVDSGYVITVDNMLKMISIQLRLRFHLPVIIMGETGCGKSSLIRSMCGALGWPLHTMNVHGGITDEDIVTWTKHKIQLARKLINPQERIVVFYDEVNTTNCMGLFKEMVCDRCMNGRRLPDNMCIIAACNPYRLRTTTSLYGGEEMAGLIFEHAGGPTEDENVGTGIKDPLRDLVYRVHPLPESMIDHIFDFGSLSSETESLYIKSMLRKQLGLFNPDDEEEEERPVVPQAQQCNQATRVYTRSYWRLTPFQEFVKVFAELICASQECIRDLSGGERSSASLRDVARCVKVFGWFGNHFYANQAREVWDLEDFFCMKPRAEKVVRKATILALAYTYHARLPRAERRALVMVLSDKWRELQLQTHDIRGVLAGTGRTAMDYLTNWSPPVPRCRWLRLEAKEFVSVLEETQRQFVSQMNLGEGIALNEALCENLFMILVSVLNQVPIFVIGKPGSSKSLAMGLVASNLNGDASDSNFLRSLPAVEVFSYQCSPLSTSQGIEQAFEAARRYKQEAGNTVVVVLLDEVGLAEQSPHLPLKVLHKMLDEAGAGEAVVGISNWALDPAKMNRAVHLYRPAPTVDDLSMTAEGMVRSANLKGYLSALARSYSTVYHGQEHPDFWGLREFYSTVRAINAALRDQRETEGTEGVALNSKMLLNAVLRNFGGRPQEIEKVIGIFFEELGLPIPAELLLKTSVEMLVRENLGQTEARHLMLLTKNNAALGLMFDRDILKLDHTEVIFGSDFPLDQTDLQICLDIQRIKLCMAEGITVVLVYGERLYESLYDLLNQHYCEYGGQLYVRLAFGTHSRLCPIHKKFRIIVVVEKIEAYTRLAPPLLNRFEKQVLEHRDVMLESNIRNLVVLQSFCTDFVAAAETGAGLMESRAAFCGYHTDMLSSLLTAVSSEMEKVENSEQLENTDEILIKECCNRLLWIASPESTCRLLAAEDGKRHNKLSVNYGEEISDVYFHKQKHSSLPAFCETMLAEWSDHFGSQTIVMTYSPLSSNVREILQEQTQWKNVSHVVLHELDQERDLRSKVNEFFTTNANTAGNGGAVLLVQCDPLATSLRRIEHAKFICENARAKCAGGQTNADLKFSEYKSSNDEGQPLGVGEEKDSGPPTEAQDGTEVSPANEESSKKGVHVILLLHLPRGSDSMYCVSFDTRWHYAFVDSIQPADNSGLPEVEAMIGKSMKEVVANLSLAKVLRRALRPSLARLVYTFERTNEGVRRQIGMLLGCLDDAVFLETIRKVIDEMLGQTEDTLNVASAAHEERELQLAGTFQAALHQQILETVSFSFAVALSHMDRNSGFKLVNENILQHLWFKLFHVSFWEMNIYAIAKSGMSRAKSSISSRRRFGELEVTSDGFMGKAFEMKFPFSFYIWKILETMRTTSESQGLEAMAQQFNLLALDLESLDEELLKRYAYDMCCMSTIEISGIQREEQTNVFWRILQLTLRGMTSDDEEEKGSSQELDSLPALHFAFWKVEQEVSLYFSLLEAVPSAQEDTTQYLMNDASLFQGETHAKFLEIIIAALMPARQLWQVLADYSQWMQNVDKARPLITSLLELAGENATMDWVTWEKIEFFYAFLRDVAYPLKVDIPVVLSTFESLTKISLNTQAALQTIVSMLVNLNRETMKMEFERFTCPITLERLVEPVFAADGHTYERAAIENWFSTGHNTSPVTNLPLESQVLIRNKKLQKEIHDELQADMSNFLEYYIFDILFSHKHKNTLAPETLCELLGFLSGRSTDASVEARHLANVLPSEAGKIGLLRELLALEEEQQQKTILEKLGNDLRESVTQAHFLDTPLCVYYCTVVEQQLLTTSELDLLEYDYSPIFAVEEMENPVFEVEKVLGAIARARFLISSFAEDLTSLLDQEIHVEVIPHKIVQKHNAVDALLSVNTGKDGIVRSMRVFLVKQLERQKGLSFTRGAFMQEPLSSANWFSSWKDSGDTGFLRFLGTNRLPRQNPLQDIPGFIQTSGILASYLTTGNLQVLGEELSNLAQNMTPEMLKGSLVASLFHEVHLLSAVMSDSDAVFGKISALQNWLINSTDEPLSSLFTPAERRIFALFSGPSAAQSPAHNLINLDRTSSTESLLLVRFIAHATSCAFFSPFFSWVRTLMMEPGRLVGSFVPTMPEDVTKMAQNVMGGRWYSCPNGHPFYVDLCGRPTVIQQCAECGADIGGTNHDLLEGNVDIGNVGTAYYQTTTLEDRSEKNYCLREAQVEAEERYFSARMLGPISIQTLRLIMHAVMVVGIASGGQNWENSMRGFFNQTFCNPNDANTFIVDHTNSNWATLKVLLNRSTDDLSLVLHLGLLSAGGSANEQDEPPAVGGDPLPALPAYADQITSEYRSAWEAIFHRQHFHRHLAETGMDERLEHAVARFSPSDEGDVSGGFLAEVQEKYEVGSLSLEQRYNEMPALWGYRRPFSYEHFSMSLNMLAQQKDRHYLLSTFVEKEKELRSLSHLPAVFKWLQLLLKRYNRRLDRNAARELTVGAVLGEIAPTDRPLWEESFLGFRNAWNLSWRSVERFGCTRIPPDFVQMEMDYNTPLTFCLPTDTDEGICPLALVRYLVDQHNNFVQAVDERILLSRRSTHRADSRTASVSSRHFTAAHAVSYDLQGDFIPFLEKRCVSVTANGGLHYDFKKAEARLLNQYFPTVPIMDLELRAFVFAHEQHLSGGLAPLRQKVKQQPLPPDTEDAIRRDITTPAQASCCLEILETAISFLTATGGSFMKRLDETVGEMMFLQYLRTVLLMEDTSQLGSRAVVQQVQLKHLEALWNLLSTITEVDPLESVNQRYTEPLSENMAEILKTRGQNMEIGTLIPLLKGFIVNQLQEGTMDPESKAKDNIGWIDTGDVYLMDHPWFMDNWPDSMPLKNIVAAFKLLQNISV